MTMEEDNATMESESTSSSSPPAFADQSLPLPPNSPTIPNSVKIRPDLAAYFEVVSDDPDGALRCKLAGRNECRIDGKVVGLIYDPSRGWYNFKRHLITVHKLPKEEFSTDGRLLGPVRNSSRRTDTDTKRRNEAIPDKKAPRPPPKLVTMTPTTRSSSPNCLFCWKVCIQSTPQLERRMEGAVHCPLLEKHLLQFFILRQLLEIPSTWCEQTLQAVDENGSPDSWFRICSSCFSRWVRDAWQAYQGILELESKMRTIKESIKETMRKKQRFGLGNRVDERIRELVSADTIQDCVDPLKCKVESSLTDTDSCPVPVEVDVFLNNGICSTLKIDPLLPDPDEPSGANSDDDYFPDGGDNNDDDDYVCDEAAPIKRRQRSRAKAKKLKIPNVNRTVKTRPPSAAIKRKRIWKKKKKRIPSSLNYWRFCTKCPSRFSIPEELESHLRSHEESSKNGGLYDCSVCSFPARNNAELDVHMGNRHGPNGLRKPYSCPKCEFKTKTWKIMKAHCEAQHPDEEAAIVQLHCNICMRDFECRSSLTSHRKKMHPELYGSKQEPLQCDLCPQRFQSRIHLRYHVQRTHLRVTKFVCDICGKGFSLNRNLLRHKVSHEKDDKGKREFVCHICGCDYLYRTVLDEHYRQFHPEVMGKDPLASVSSGQPTNEQEFACKYCDLKTPYKPVLVRHMQIHKAEMGHQCDLCSKYYTNIQGLNRHKRLNHPTTKEVVYCPHCFKEYPNVDYMRTHVAKYCKLKDLKNTNEHSEEMENAPPTPATQMVPGSSDPDSLKLKMETI